jgi:hypothetical protein
MGKDKGIKNKKNQLSKFMETAREHGCDESKTAFDAKLKKLVKSEKSKKSKKGKRND